MYVVLDRMEKLIQIHAVDLTERYVEPYFHAYLALIMLDCQGWQVCQSPLICEITYLSVKVEYSMLSLVFCFPCWMLQSYSLIAVTIGSHRSRRPGGRASIHKWTSGPNNITQR
jgi:hypothetical protein